MNGILGTTTIQHVTKKFIDNILETECNGKYKEPYGLFYYYSTDDRKYIAMDNSEGDVWMEEFDSYGECVLWLLAVVNAQGEPIDDNDKPINKYFK